MDAENKERRKINQAILDRIINLDPDSIKIGGQVVRVVGGDQVLAKIFGVTRQTIAAWRNQGVIPYRPAGGSKHAAIYKIKDVIEALRQHSMNDLDEAVQAEMVENHFELIRLREKVDQLEQLLKQYMANNEGSNPDSL